MSKEPSLVALQKGPAYAWLHLRSLQWPQLVARPCKGHTLEWLGRTELCLTLRNPTTTTNDLKCIIVSENSDSYGPEPDEGEENLTYKGAVNIRGAVNLRSATLSVFEKDIGSGYVSRLLESNIPCQCSKNTSDRGTTQTLEPHSC